MRSTGSIAHGWRRSVRSAGQGAALAAAWALAACGTPQAPRFHSLVAPPAASAAVASGSSTVQPAGALAWEVLPVTVPPGVDQPQWVVRSSVDGSLVVLEQERWVGPLADEVRAAVTAQLAQTLGAPGAKAAPVWRVRIDVLRVELAPGREARIEAIWAILGDNGAAALRCRGEFVDLPADAGFASLSVAMQKSVSRLGGAIALGLRGMAAGQGAGCAG